MDKLQKPMKQNFAAHRVFISSSCNYEHPLVSVVIPTLNRCKALSYLLDSIAKQTIEPNLFEVIAVDNGSVDSTIDVLDSFVKIMPNIRYYHDPSPGLHVGRHKGLKEAKTDILVYVDDDSLPTPSWLEGVLDSFIDERVVLVGGKVLPKFEAPPPFWLQDMWKDNHPEGKVLGYLSIMDFRDQIKEIDPHYVFGCNFAIRKSILLEAGGFHPDGMPDKLIRFRGDGETYVSNFIQKMGYKALYNPKASVFHCIPKERMTVKYFCKRAFNQGISDSYTDIRTGRKRSAKHFLMRKFKYYILKGMGRKIQADINKSYWNGYQYHQKEVESDPSLLNWVLKTDYRDIDIKKYCPDSKAEL